MDYQPNFKIILFASKVLSNGDSPVVIRATYQRQRKYVSTGISGRKENWNEKFCLFEPNDEKLTPAENRANQVLKKKANEVELLRLYFNEVPFTFDRFQQRLGKTGRSVFILPYIKKIVTQLETQNRYGTARCYKDTHNRLWDFKNRETLSFHDIDLKFLNSFEVFLLKTNGINSVSIFLRTLRAVFNRAIKEGIIKRELYPFEGFKIKSEGTRKRSLTKSEIDELKKFKSIQNSRQWHSLQFFLFSYYSRGMNFLDMATLTWDNIHNGRIFYKRKKTGDAIDLLIDKNLAEIIASYRANDRYIFPILNEGLSPLTIRNRIKTRLKKANKDLKTIAGEIGIRRDLTFYWARHTFATTLKRAGVSIAMISETLAHSSEKVTRNYLDSFDTDQLDEISKLL